MKRMLWAIVTAVVAIILGTAAITPGDPVEVLAGAGYAYDNQVHPAVLTFATAEPLPPSAYDPGTSRDALHCWRRCAPTPSGSATPTFDDTYNDLAEAVQVAKTAVRSSEVTPGVQRTIARATRSHVAAETGAEMWSVDALSSSGSRLVGKDLTRAGQELAKHAGQGEFPVPTGPPSAISRLGQEQLDDILTSPGARIEDITKGNFAGGKYYIAPDGRGAAFDSSGVFQYFGVYTP